MFKTIICHFYNEEYLLPWWLEHHKKYFDHGIMIDYASTDRSVEIIKKICPDWTIVPSRNKFFDAVAIDQEVMDIEKGIDGWRVALNVTEFLVGDYSILNDQSDGYTVPCYIMVDTKPDTEPSYNLSLFEQKHHGIHYHGRDVFERRPRLIHRNPNINYPLGRHYPSFSTEKLAVLWYGWSPYNSKFKQRKLQIQNRIPESDKARGFGSSHLQTENQSDNQYYTTMVPRTVNLSFEISKLNHSPFFSIVCPVYEMKDGLSEKFLIEYLSNLTEQSFKSFEVIISDQSSSDRLQDICNMFSKVIDIRYIRNTTTIKTAGANVNYAVQFARGEVVKLLYMDDFFCDVNALAKIKKAFDDNPDNNWLISGFVHTNQNRDGYFNGRQPRYDETWPNGDNSTGNPSNYSVRRKCLLLMDENLKWVVDGEYFYRTYYHFGNPIMIPEVLVCFREHDDSAFLKPEFRDLDEKERAYVERKFGRMVQHQ